MYKPPNRFVSSRHTILGSLVASSLTSGRGQIGPKDEAVTISPEELCPVRHCLESSDQVALLRSEAVQPAYMLHEPNQPPAIDDILRIDFVVWERPFDWKHTSDTHARGLGWFAQHVDQCESVGFVRAIEDACYSVVDPLESEQRRESGLSCCVW